MTREFECQVFYCNAGMDELERGSHETAGELVARGGQSWGARMLYSFSSWKLR